MGIEDAKVFIKGSSVIGVSWKTKISFDVGRVSDWDISIISPQLLKRAEESGVKLWVKGKRGPPLDLNKKSSKLNLRKSELESFAFIMSYSLEALIGPEKYLHKYFSTYPTCSRDFSPSKIWNDCARRKNFIRKFMVL